MSTNLPSWFVALRNEYKAQAEKVTPEAQVRLMRKFAEVPEHIMSAAVERYMDNEVWFPIVATLRPYVTTAEQDMSSRDETDRESPLHKERHALLTALYAGDFVAEERVEALAALYERAGMSFSAAYLRRKAKEMTP